MTKKLRKILPIVILISIGLGVMQSKKQFMVQGVLPTDSYIGENFSWHIQNITSDNNQWLNWTSFTFEANWHANIGDEVNLTISDSKIINDKTYLEGNFKIGNLSIATNDYDIGSNLAISCYPWVGGLITLESSWDDLSDQSPFNSTTASVQTDMVVYVFEKPVAAVMIRYDDSFQTSVFYYEKETGILISASTNVGSYRLILSLDETSIPLPTTVSSVGIGYGFITTVVIGCLSLLIASKKRK